MHMINFLDIQWHRDFDEDFGFFGSKGNHRIRMIFEYNYAI